MINANYLKLTFEPDDDGTGELFATFSSNGFAGHGSAWFDKKQLIEISKEFERYPLTKDEHPMIAGGFWDKEEPGHLEQEHLHISVYPVDLKGNLGVRVCSATELGSSSRKEAQHYIGIELRTNYQGIADFSKKLRSLIEGTIYELRLNGL